MGKAIPTYQTFLMYKDPAVATMINYEKLIDITTFPDLGGEPSTIDTTTLSDPVETFILGLQSQGALTFTANYWKEDVERILGLSRKDLLFSVWFGGNRVAGVEEPTGDRGKWSWQGQLTAWPTGGGTNDKVGLSITLSAATPPELEP